MLQSSSSSCSSRARLLAAAAAAVAAAAFLNTLPAQFTFDDSFAVVCVSRTKMRVYCCCMHARRVFHATKAGFEQSLPRSSQQPAHT